MPLKFIKPKLIYFVVVTLLSVGLIPLVISGWLSARRSATELRAAENRYQTQLVQNKARQIEMFGTHYAELVRNFSQALEFSNDLAVLSAPQTENNLQTTLKENPNLLAFFVKPIQGEPLAVFRPEQISRQQIETVTSETLAKLNDRSVVFGKPQSLTAGGELILPIATPVFIDKKLAAAAIAIVSLNGFQPIINETNRQTQAELLQAGLPIIFVVEENGRVVFHPDAQIRAEKRDLSGLKIVEEWKNSSRLIESALVPFESEFDGKNYRFLGSYSNAVFSFDLRFGVIVMQNEDNALASVGEIWRNIWLISLVLALAALFVGFFLARRLTAPLGKFVGAARQIAAGDLSARVEDQKIEEIGTLADAFNSMSDKLAAHIENLARAARENHELFVGTVKALAAAIDGKDRYTRGHSERVSRISVAVGGRLGLDEGELEVLRISALLHDVGKIGIDDAILKKPAALTDEEFEVMKTHPYRGYKIMSQIGAMKEYLPGIYMHHEMINGAGYPQGLSGTEIPLQAKIISVADTFDAMTIDRPYQKGMTLDAALARIGSFVGTRYDGKIVEALVAACNEGQIGIGTVKLKAQPQKENLMKNAA